jgi:hypothetical protein
MSAYSATRPSIKAKIPKPTSAASMRAPGADAAPPLPSMDTSVDEGETREVPELPPALEMPDIEPAGLDESVIAIENALLAPIPGVIPDTVDVPATSAVDPESQLTEDGSEREPGANNDAMESDDDEASVASGLSTASINSIKSLAYSLESSGFTMVPTAEALVADFGTFWSNNSHLGFTAVMIAFLSFMHSRGLTSTLRTGFFNNLNISQNLRGPVVRAIESTVTTDSADSSLFSRISSAFSAFATALGSTATLALGANMLVEEPLTIDNVTNLLFSAGESIINVQMSVHEFILQLQLKYAALKALGAIKQTQLDTESIGKHAKIQGAVESAGGLLNEASAELRRSGGFDIATMRDRFNVIINNLKTNIGAGAGARDDRGAGGPGRGGKRQSQKQQKQKQQKQKKTQKQQKKLSKSKRAKKAKQSKKANKKH